jgi:hypothetical protein
MAQLRSQIVPWSSLCRAHWVRNDLVLAKRGGCYATTTQFLGDLREAMRSLISLGKRGYDRPTTTGWTPPAPDAYNPLFACHDAPLSIN